MWKDITELCKEAKSLLDYENPMITTSKFSLHESMMANEVSIIFIFIYV